MRASLYMTGAVGYDDVFARATQLFVPALLEAADIAPGHDVLDVATGTGIAAAAAHAAVGPSGTVVAGDISPAMLDIARVKLRDLPVVLQVMDAHLLPYADCRFDAVICQLGLMLFAKPARALAEFHRVLRPGGRASVTVSTVPQRTLFLRVAAVIARHVPARAAELARHFNIVETEDLRGLLAAAGFRDVRVESERREFQFASFEDYFAGIENGATLSGQEFVRLPAPVRSAVRDEVRRSLVGGSDGPFAIPMEVLIGSGRR